MVVDGEEQPPRPSPTATCDCVASGTTVRRGRACVPCHERKVRCIPSSGDSRLPCARCIKSNRVADCVAIPVATRSGRPSKRKRVEHPPDHHHHQQPQTQTQIHQQDLHDLDPSLRDPGSSLPLSPNSLRPRAMASPTRTQGEPLAAAMRLPQQSQQDRLPGIEAASNQGEADADAVSEDDTHLQICREMSRWTADARSRTEGGQVGTAGRGRGQKGQEVIEYHDGVNPLTILGDLFAQKRPKRLIRILFQGSSDPLSCGQAGQAGQASVQPKLDDYDREYLQKKEAYALFSRPVCLKLLRRYFECVYPYAPILDRIEFLSDFERDTYSPFLMQCVLANSIPYASLELLHEAGFPDRPSAQKTVVGRARLLYDFGTENSQLRLLQGSLVLSSLQFAFALDKDYRFWLTNAVRLAMQMGLHRNNIWKDVDEPTRKLVRRIWWVLYSRDLLLTVSGLDNVRRLKEQDFDTAELTEADWDDDELVPPNFAPLLPPITLLQKNYLIENCRLARISSQFLQAFKCTSPRLPPPLSAVEDLENSISAWRRSLPDDMRIDLIQDWSSNNVWILVLMAMSYRLECVFYRTLEEHAAAGGSDASSSSSSLSAGAQRSQLNAMIQMDAVIDRLVLNDLAPVCPLSVTICVSTVIAMHIETALKAPVGSSKRLVSRNRIHSGLAFLRASCEFWSSVRWTLRLFEVIVSHTGLAMTTIATTDGEDAGFDIRSMNPFKKNCNVNNINNNNNNNNSGRPGEESNNVQINGGMFNMDHDHQNNSNVGFPFQGLGEGEDDDFFGVAVGRDAEEWFQDLLTLDSTEVS